MKQPLIFAALALVAAFPARAEQEVCFDVDTGRKMDNGYPIHQRICAEEGKPLPVKLRMVEERAASTAIVPSYGVTTDCNERNNWCLVHKYPGEFQ